MLLNGNIHIANHTITKYVVPIDLT